MLLVSIRMVEMFAETRRRELEGVVVRQRLLAEVGARKTSIRPRQTIAGALVRIATMIDAGAATHTAAAHGGQG